MGNVNLKSPDISSLLTNTNSINQSITVQLNEKLPKEKEKERDKAAVAVEKQNFESIHKHNKECKDAELIEKCLINHFFLRSLEKQSRVEIIKEMSSCTIKEGIEIFKQGQDSGHFFIISKGIVELKGKNYPTKNIKEGECFGDISILYDTKREATAKTKSECKVWIMEKRNFKKVIEHIIHITFEDNNKNSNNISLFNVLDHENKIKILNNLYRETHFENINIFTKNMSPGCLYFLKDGEVNLMEDKTLIRKISKEEYFGELSILLGRDRILSAIPKEKSHIYSLPIATLYNIYGDKYREFLLLGLIKSAFICSPKFKNINLQIVEDCFSIFKLSFYEKETVVQKAGALKNSEFLIPISGCLKEEGGGIICKKGIILNSEDIYDQTQNKFDKNVVASAYSLVASGKSADFMKKFGCSFKELIEKSSAIDQLKRVGLFKNFTNSKLENLSKKIKCKKYKNGENVITQGEEGTEFYIIKKGMVDIFVGEKYIRTMNENEYLGERALFFKEPRSATAKAHGDAEIFYLEKQEFETVIEKNLKEYLEGRLYLQDNTVKLEELTFYMNLGCGSYGNVSLVKSKKNNYFYAIKNISLKQIKYSQLHSNLELERSILLQIDHPFIVKLVKTLKDDKYVYFLMDYIKGKELFDVIRDIGLLNKFQTQFYGGSMMLAVQYLHERKFVFRDIKPENIMVLDNGFIKVIDFGTAKKIEDKTSTIIGTPHYMAPEVIMGEGYSFQVDFWSIAICMYEFICGAVPFGETAEEPMDVYLSIIHDQLGFPSFVKDRDFKNLMQLMLNKNYQTRYCKLTQISSHIWFQNFNWDDLISLNMKPAYIPKIESNEAKYNQKPYMSYIQTLKDWEIPENQQPLTKENIKEFDEWLKKF